MEKAYICTSFNVIFFIMSCILNIETSTDVCSIAVSQEGACVFEREDHSGPNHAVKLGVFIDEALAYIDSRDIHLDAVAVSCGPGSYTGLRIGVSMAKGVCYGRDAKLIAVPTLDLLCVPVLLGEKAEEEALLCRPIQADVVDADTYREYLDRGPVCFFGNGAAKCIETINHPNAQLIRGIEPLARNMFPLAEQRMARGQFEDVAYFTPFYLKDFVAKPSKKLI